MSKSLHRDSSETTISEPELFHNPGSQTAQEETSFVEYRPLSVISENGPIEFSINYSTDLYTDLSSTILYVKCANVNNDDTPLGNTGVAAPTELLSHRTELLHSLFSQVEIFLNGTLVSTQSYDYLYRAYMQNLLSYGSEAKKRNSLLLCFVLTYRVISMTSPTNLFPAF